MAACFTSTLGISWATRSIISPCKPCHPLFFLSLYMSSRLLHPRQVTVDTGVFAITEDLEAALGEQWQLFIKFSVAAWTVLRLQQNVVANAH